MAPPSLEKRGPPTCRPSNIQMNGLGIMLIGGHNSPAHAQRKENEIVSLSSEPAATARRLRHKNYTWSSGYEFT